VGSILAVFDVGHKSSAVNRVYRMAAVSTYRGQPRVWSDSVAAVGVQSLGWDASLAWSEEWVVAFHGYVTNWEDVAVVSPGSAANAELLLSLWSEAGRECVVRLRGEFSVVAYHRCTGRIFLARDFLGKRPLFFSRKDGGLVVASEIRQVIVGADLPRRLRPEVTIQWIAGLDPPEGATEYEGVLRVAPAAVYTLERADCSPATSTFWRAPEERDEREVDREDAKQTLGLLLRRAAQRALVGVEDVAVAVSSGLDSAALWALLCQDHPATATDGRRCSALSLVFPGLSCDEREGVRALHAWCGTKGREVDAASESPLARAAYLRERCDRLVHPMAFTIGLLAEEAARQGSRVLLTAHGPDEVLAGRFSYLADLLFQGRLAAFLRDCFSVQLRSGRRLRFVARQLVAAWRLRKPKARRPAPAWLSPQAWEAIQTRRPAQPPAGLIHSAQIRVLVSGYQAGPSLDAFEQLAASAGVEHRSPFLDQDLFDYALTLPGRVLTGGRRVKWLLRTVLEGRIPDHLRMAWKVGYETLIDRDAEPLRQKLMEATRRNPAAVLLLTAWGLDNVSLSRHTTEESLRGFRVERVLAEVGILTLETVEKRV